MFFFVFLNTETRTSKRLKKRSINYADMLRLGIYRVNGLSSGCIISDYILKDISTMKTRTLRIVLKLCLKLRRSLQMPSLLRNISWLSLATIVNDPTVEHRRKLRWPVKFWYYCASVKRNRQFEPYLPLTLCRRSHSRRVMIVLSRHKSNRVTVCIMFTHSGTWADVGALKE